jgi:LysR family transcriptional regulator for bpeEF and oprC
MDKLRAIKFFCRVAETTSFAAAAYDLDVVPSVLSKSVATLEADIGFRLFNRTTRRVSLTENGAQYYDRCKRLIDGLEEAEIVTRRGASQPAGRLLAGLHPSINRILMSRIGEFLEKYPDVAVETTMASTNATLIEDKLDVLIALGHLADSSLGARRIATTELVLVASPIYLHAYGVPQTPKELAKHAITLSARRDGPSFAHWALTKDSKTETIYVPARTVCREGVHMHEACLGGAGISRMVEVSVRPFLVSGHLKRVLPDWSFGPLPIHAMFPSRKGVPAKVRVLVDFLRSVLNEKRWWLKKDTGLVMPAPTPGAKGGT